MSERPALQSIPLFRRTLEPEPVRTVFTAAELPTPTTDQIPVDWGEVVRLRRTVSERISARSRARIDEGLAPLSPADTRMMGRSVIREVVREHAQQLGLEGTALWSGQVEQDYAGAVEDAVFGFGRLQPLFDLDGAENIELNGHDDIRVQYSDGRRVSHPPVADSDAELVEAIRFLGETASPPRAFDDAHPTMTVALGDRFRLHAIGFGLSHRPAITIRQHLLTDVTLDDLVGREMLPPALARLLTAAVLAGSSIVVSGDQGAGKTTLLRALIAAIPAQHRIGTIETDYELLTHLLPGRGNVVALQARTGLGELVDGRRVGEHTVADLIPEALRQNLSRIVVGEVRGVEAGAMVEAMMAGTGSFSTTHSRAASQTIDRLAARIAAGGSVGIDDAYRQLAGSLDLVVHLDLVDDTWRGGTRRRRVGEVLRLTGGVEADRPTTHRVYAADDGQVVPDAPLVDRLRPYLGGGTSAW